MSRKTTINEALQYLRNAYGTESELRAREFIADVDESPEGVKTAFIDYFIAMRHVKAMERKEAFKSFTRE